jgi:hypothetical protein
MAPLATAGQPGTEQVGRRAWCACLQVCRGLMYPGGAPPLPLAKGTRSHSRPDFPHCAQIFILRRSSGPWTFWENEI